jgi:hypothetical protein
MPQFRTHRHMTTSKQVICCSSVMRWLEVWPYYCHQTESLIMKVGLFKFGFNPHTGTHLTCKHKVHHWTIHRYNYIVNNTQAREFIKEGVMLLVRDGATEKCKLTLLDSAAGPLLELRVPPKVCVCVRVYLCVCVCQRDYIFVCLCLCVPLYLCVWICSWRSMSE